jgi:hypothetical protein
VFYLGGNGGENVDEMAQVIGVPSLAIPEHPVEYVVE